MNKLLEDLKISARVQEGPLGPYIGAYAAQLFSEGYARQSSCVKIRFVGAFSRWLSPDLRTWLRSVMTQPVDSNGTSG